MHNEFLHLNPDKKISNIPEINPKMKIRLIRNYIKVQFNKTLTNIYGTQNKHNIFQRLTGLAVLCQFINRKKVFISETKGFFHLYGYMSSSEQFVLKRKSEAYKFLKNCDSL